MYYYGKIQCLESPPPTSLCIQHIEYMHLAFFVLRFNISGLMIHYVKPLLSNEVLHNLCSNTIQSVFHCINEFSTDYAEIGCVYLIYTGGKN